MLEFNLLPSQKKGLSLPVDRELTLFLCLAITVFAVFLGWHSLLASRSQALGQEIAAQEARRSVLLKEVKVLRNREDALRLLQDRLQALRGIRRTQGQVVQHLDALVRQLPRNRIWFESLELAKGQWIRLRGIASDNQAFASYVQRLRSCAFVTSIYTRQTSQRQIKQQRLVEFQAEVRTDAKDQGAGEDG
jgi:type IV pilus assembly protein PilN